MKFKNAFLFFFLFTEILVAQHVSSRKQFITDITNKSGTSVFYFPTSLPLADRACVMNSNREITSSSVTSTELGFLSGVSSAIQTQLNAKASSSHSHIISDVTSLQAALDAKAATSHSHVIADTTGLQTALDGKQATGNYITALTGDVTAAGPGSIAATIAASAVSNSKLANMNANTIKGNNTGGAAAPSDLTAAQTTAMLDSVVGDSGSGGTKGLVPAPAAGDAAAGKFLKADGSWSVPSGGGGGGGSFPSAGYFGNGANGNATINSTVTVFYGENYYNNLTIQSGGILRPSNIPIFVKGTLTIDSGGAISSANTNGSNASGTSGASGGSEGSTLSILTQEYGSNSGGAGGTGAGSQAGAMGAVGTILRLGGASGNGGAGGTGSGGAGGAARNGIVAEFTNFQFLQVGTAGVSRPQITTPKASLPYHGQGGPGGSGGGGDGTAGGGGGGGGSGGTAIFIYCNELINNGTIRANGGNGGNGFTPVAGNRGGGGGGAGGGGGFIYIIAKTITTLGTITVDGGTGGTGGSGSGTGTAGANGTDGDDGHYSIFEFDTNTWTTL